MKSRTWSRRDAEHKALAARALIEFLGASPDMAVRHDYLEMVESGGSLSSDGPLASGPAG